MNKLFFYTIFLIVLLFSCKNKNSSTNDENEIIELNIIEKPKSIDGELIEIEGFLLPDEMILQDSILFVKDSRAEKYIHLVDLKNKKYLTSFAAKGKGPGELLGASTMDYYNNKLWVHDITLSKLISFDKDSLLNGSHGYTNEIQLKEKARQNFNLTWINDTIITSTTFSESPNRLIFTNNKGVVSYEAFEMIPPEKKDTPRAIHNQSYQSVLKKNPNHNKIAVVNRYSDLLEIYDLDEKSSKRFSTHQNFTPIYDVVNVDGNVRMGQGETTRFGSIDISVTENKIFTLYSGRTRGEGYANYADKIYVYDWQGNYLNSYEIPNLAIGILAENDYSLLTLEYKEGIPMLKRYSLDEK